MNIRSYSKIFELEFENGIHLPCLSKKNVLMYESIDISKSMTEETNLNNNASAKLDKASFRYTVDSEFISNIRLFFQLLFFG